MAVWLCCAWGTGQAGENPAAQETSVYSALSMGTAWALSPRHLVTNYHVVAGMQNLRIVTQAREEIPVTLLVKDQTNDLAILYIPDQHHRVKPLTMALTRPKLGAQVFTIGYPHPNLMGTNPKLTSGLINAMSGLADDPRTYQVSVPVQAGNSGGPLINMNGEVIGVITSKLSAQKMFEWTGDVPQNVNYAIKVKYLNALLGEVEMSEPVIAGGSRQHQTLETLAENIIQSVVIIAGDGDKQVAGHGGDFLAHKEPEAPEAQNKTRTIVISSYAEPGNYDINERITGSSTIQNYSRNTIKLLEENLQGIEKDVTNVIIKTNEGDGRFFYNLERPLFIKNICTNHKAEKIIASYSEMNPGSQYRYVKFRVVDCQMQKEFHKRYKIERDENNDRFGYEVALHVSFKDFMLKLPPFIQWAAK